MDASGFFKELSAGGKYVELVEHGGAPPRVKTNPFITF